MANPEFEELKKAGLSVHDVVNTLYAATKVLLDAAMPIRNVVLQLGDHKTEFENALAGTYFRMCLLMESLIRLNKKQDFQVSLHSARLMYELYLDIVDLIRDPTLLARFKAFTFVARFAAADKLVSELTSQGTTDPEINKLERDFVADAKNRARFDADKLAHWPVAGGGTPKAPLNWTGKNLPDRAATIGPAELLRYRRLYSFLCWYSHAGFVGIAYISAEGLEAAMGTAHGHAQNFFYEATTLIAKQFDIYKANPELRPPIDKYQETTGKLLEQHLRQLAAKRE